MWEIEDLKVASLVRMNSNGINKLNPEFFDDLTRTFDFLEREHPGKPVILASQNPEIFSVGLDFDYTFELLGTGDRAVVTEWFKKFRGIYIRLFSYPAKTIALVNGHAFAGGLILALCCDFRIGTGGRVKFALNEVNIGIPMPAVYNEIIRQKVGSANTFDTVLSGRVFQSDEALAMGFLNKIVAPDGLVRAATVEARKLEPDAWSTYAHTKSLLIDDALEYIQGKANSLDQKSLEVIISREAQRIRIKALEKIKRSDRIRRKKDG